MRAKLATVAVMLFLTATFFALGISALGEASTTSAAVGQQATNDGENAAVSAFKFV